MGEYSEHTQKNMYECIDPGIRFVMLSDIILNDIGTPPDGSTIGGGPETAVWPSTPNGYYFKLEKSLRLWGFHNMVYVVLEHYIDALPPDQPLTRYSVVFNPWMVSEITIVDENLDPILSDSRQGREAAQQALSILSTQAGSRADELLDNIISQRFEDIAGRYVLSNLAVVNNQSLPAMLDDQKVEDAMVDYLRREIEIRDEEGARSLIEDSVAKHLIVSDAISTPASSGRHGKFINIDLIKSTKITQRSLGLLWNNIVYPDQ